jgi:endoglucanase
MTARALCIRPAVLFAVLACALGAGVPAFAQAGDNDQPLSLKVEGSQLLNGLNRPVHLAGVNRSGTACIQGQGIFEGPSDDSSVRAIASWPANAVRIPLNEDCWLGINGAPDQDGAATYRSAIVDYVQTLHRSGLFAELALVAVAPGQAPATGQRPMPDADHAPDFWRSVAATFLKDPALLFGLYGAPHDVSWSCWRDGAGACSTGYTAAGMQSLIDAIRSTGAEQPIAVSGIGWGNDLSAWLGHQPRDPRHALLAEAHVYDSSACRTIDCWSRTLLPLAKRVPVVTGELGENDCRGVFLDSYLPFAHANGISYLAWSWTTGTQCTALITSYQGTPTAYGFVYKEHLAVASSPPASQSPAPSGRANPLAGPLGIALAVVGIVVVGLAVVLVRRRRTRGVG